ncbi:MAG: site-specific integrase [Oscillospiraceae bacterium]|nr:site-specific integrase [Oscillospiraceae bacterium]
MPAYKDEERGTWHVKFQYKNWKNEKKWITKRGFKTKREALQWEKDYLLQRNGSVEMSFADFVNIYRADRAPRLKESTAMTKDNIIDTKLIPYFGKKPIQEITTRDVMQWQNEMLRYRDQNTGKPYSKSYLKTIHNQLRAFFNHAVRHYQLKENPAMLAGNMGTEKGIEMDFFTKEEYLRLADALMDEPLAYYCFQVLYWCGIREGELLALTLDDIDFQKGTIRINKTFQHIKGKDIVTDPKTPKSNRVVQMPEFLVKELKDYVSMQYDLNSTDRMFPVGKSFLYRMMKKGCESAGLRKIRIHDLRHSHVSLLIHMGFSAVAIAERVGHESADITYRYSHMFPSVQNDMAARLNRMMEVGSDV